MIGGKTVSILFRIILFLVTFGIVVYAVLSFKVWSFDWSKHFLWQGNLVGWIFIMAIVAAITEVLVKLLQWQLRLETKPGKPVRIIRRRR